MRRVPSPQILLLLGSACPPLALVFLLLGSSFLLIGCNTGPSTESSQLECISLLGEPLCAPPLQPEVLHKRTALLNEALVLREIEPESEDAWIWVGRRQAYLGEYRAAVDTFTEALQLHPGSSRLLRHRGHRWITLRAFDRAESDLSLAWEIAGAEPDSVEPDGLPTPGVPPRSTNHGNILYHLGLAQYLRGSFPEAAINFGTAVRCATNDDTLVAATYWHYLALQRAGCPEAANLALAGIHDSGQQDSGPMDVRDNHSYLRLLLYFKGNLPREELVPRDGPLGIGVDRATIGYGLAVLDLIGGDEDAARSSLRLLTSEPDWPAFGHIAAEADLARMEDYRR